MTTEPFRPVRAAPAPRRRDTVLAALEAFRGLHAQVCVTQIVAFLYICENEGINLKELAFVCGATDATASRTARGLSHPDAPGSLSPALGLVELRENPEDGRGRLLYLTDKGRAMRERIDQLIAQAVQTSGQSAAAA